MTDPDQEAKWHVELENGVAASLFAAIEDRGLEHAAPGWVACHADRANERTSTCPPLARSKNAAASGAASVS